MSGKVTESSWDALIGQPWRLSGLIGGDTLTMVVSDLRLGTADTWEGTGTLKLAAGSGKFKFVACES